MGSIIRDHFTYLELPCGEQKALLRSNLSDSQKSILFMIISKFLQRVRAECGKFFKNIVLRIFARREETCCAAWDWCWTSQL